MPETAPAPPPERIGRYKIDRKIGEGGMGVVYAATDERLGRAVALKMIRGDGDETARKRLWREARAAAGVSHPNICQLFEIDEADGGLFMAMELLEGEPLAARLKTSAVSPGVAASIGGQTLDALEALHSRGFVHRDLKPSNVFLTPHGVKLLDFGLARPVSNWTEMDTHTQLTAAGAIAGTPNYMAPEQVRGEAVDPRTDVFAMAALLFEMLSGQLAFAGQTVVDVLHAVLHEQPAALSGSAAVVAMDRVIRRGLAKRPDDRYPSAGAMAVELRAAAQVLDSSDSVGSPARAMTRLIALPFRVLRADAETDFLAFSLPDAITTSLVGVKNLLVRSTAAAAGFDPQSPDLRRLASAADIDLALMGTVLRAGEQLRATAQLVEAPGGAVVWSHSTTGSLHDLFQLQDSLVEGIVRSLSMRLSERDSGVRKRDIPGNAEAYQYYLRANELARDYNKMAEARDLYLRCVELDPGYAPAWARLGRAHRIMGKYFDEADGAARAEESFQRALTLNPDLPLAHNLYAQLEADAGRAVDAMRRLLGRARIDANAELFAGLVHACRYCGLLDASIAAHEEARRLDPHVPTSVLNTYSLMRDFEQVLRMPDLERERDTKAWVLYRMGRKEEALAAMPKEVWGEWPEPARRFAEGMAAVVEGRTKEGAEIFEELARSPGFNDPEGRYYTSMVLAHAGRGDAALRMLGAAVDEGFLVAPRQVTEDPWFTALRDDPGLAAILSRSKAKREEALAVFRAEGGERLLGLRMAA